jgi:hypothetical protein
MSLSSNLIDLIDVEIGLLSAQVLRGSMVIEEYKHKTGVIIGLNMAKKLLINVLDEAKKENEV